MTKQQTQAAWIKGTNWLGSLKGLGVGTAFRCMVFRAQMNSSDLVLLKFLAPPSAVLPSQASRRGKLASLREDEVLSASGLETES